MQHQQMQQMQHQQMQHQQMQHQQMHPQDHQTHMHQQLQDQSVMGMMGPVGPMDINQQGMGGVMGPQQRYGPQMNQMPPHMRQRQGVVRHDAHGQVIIETDENLSDKEIYPGQSMSQMGKFIVSFFFFFLFIISLCKIIM